MDNLQKKISELHKKKEKIESEIDQLLEKRNKEFLTVLKQVPSPTLDSYILTGGLIYVCEQAIANPQLANQWRETGLKFRKGKSPSKSIPTAA